MVKVSIIIPCMEIGRGLERCLDSISRLNNRSFETIILPDFNKKIHFKDYKIVPTGKIRPAEKRNLGVKLAKGEILAFIDDDAYPRTDWIEKALIAFENKKIGIVGGPNLTPKEDNYFIIFKMYFFIKIWQDN